MTKLQITLAVIGAALILALVWFELALMPVLALIFVLQVILLGALATLLRTSPAPAARSQRAWLAYALAFSALWLVLPTGLDFLQLFGPSSEAWSRALIGPQSGLFVAEVLGLPVLFGALGLLSGYSSEQARTGAYAGLLAGGLVWGLGLAIAVGLILAFWPAIQHGVYSSNWSLDYRIYHQQWGDVWGFVKAELFDDPDLSGWYFLLSVLYATAGGALGTWLVRRVQAAPRRPAGWRAGPVLGTAALWVLAFGLMLIFKPQAAHAVSAPPHDPMVILGPLAWLAMLAVILWAMRRATRPVASP